MEFRIICVYPDRTKASALFNIRRGTESLDKVSYSYTLDWFRRALNELIDQANSNSERAKRIIEESGGTPQDEYLWNC